MAADGAQDVSASSGAAAADADADNQMHTAKLRKDEAAVTLPHNRLGLVFPSLMLCVFLAALDSTITANAAPAICRQLGCSNADLGWIGSSYLLGSAALMPAYGRLSDIVGRKAVMYSGILLFLLFSGLCGGAKTIKWFIACRAFQGIGGGIIIGMTQIIISDIVSLRDRGKYSAYIGSVWGIASLLGPLFAGAILHNNGSFAWCFWLNLPTGGIAAATLFFFLNLNPTTPKPISYHLKTFDFPGMLALTAGVICLLLGFSEAQDLGWQSAVTIALITVGGALIFAAIVWDFYTDRQAILPPRLFRNRTTAILLLGNLSHGIGFFAASYFGVLIFQAVHGDSALLSAVELLPLSLVSALMSIVSGQFVTRTGKWKWILCASWGLFTLGMGLLILLDADSSRGMACGLLLVAGIGIGALFQTPLIGIQAAMPISEMATSTGAYVLVRSVGTTLGVSIGSLVFTMETTKRLAQIPGYVIPSSITQDLNTLVKIADPATRHAVLQAYSTGLQYIWIVCTPLVGVTFLATLSIKEYSLKTNQIKRGKAAAAEESKTDSEAERAETPVDAVEGKDEVELGDKGEQAEPVSAPVSKV